MCSVQCAVQGVVCLVQCALCIVQFGTLYSVYTIHSLADKGAAGALEAGITVFLSSLNLSKQTDKQTLTKTETDPKR